MATSELRSKLDFPTWQLHRGFWKEGIRENTLRAFEEAKKMHCEMVELDVHMSRDGVLHVYHDFDLDRIFHIKKKISRTGSEDLSGLNISKLEEVLKSENVPQYLNVEVKTQSFFAYKITKVLIKTLSQFQGAKKVLISSFHPLVVFWIRVLSPKTPRALIVGDKNKLMSRTFEWQVRWAKPHFINCHYSLIEDEETREFLLYFGKPLMVWTVNDPVEAEKYLKRGAKSIISDLPPRVL